MKINKSKKISHRQLVIRKTAVTAKTSKRKMQAGQKKFRQSKAENMKT